MPAQSLSGPSPLGLETIFYCLTFETSLFVASYDSQGHGGGTRPNLEGQVPVFISPRNRVALLYPQTLGSLFVASYDLQGYSEGIRPRLHTCF
jgi:hypothetical protein